MRSFDEFYAPLGVGFVIATVLTIIITCAVKGAKSDETLAEEPTKSGRLVFTRIEEVPRWSFCLIHDTATGKDYLAAMHGGTIELGAVPAEAK